MTEIATSNSWKNLPIINPKWVEHRIYFSESQFVLLTKGLLPASMDDKWFVFYEGGFLSVHRSWTGRGIYKTEIIREENDYFITGFWVERDAQTYTFIDDDYDRKILNFILAALMLNIGASELRIVTQDS